jgi:hypothetical protein
MKRGDRVKVPGFVLSVTDGIAEIEFAGTYPDNGHRIRITVEAIDPEDVRDTEAAIRELATRPLSMRVTRDDLIRGWQEGHHG